MIKLYIKQNCGFSKRALDAAEELGVELDIKDIADETALKELMEIGGKKQEPFLVDEENNVNMYESDSIIDYFEKITGKTASRHKDTPQVCSI